MLSLFYPYAYADSVFEIDYPSLYRKGFRSIIFDIDNTLVPHGADSTPEVDAFFHKLHDLGFQTLLLSNNDKERVERFITNFDTMYICDASKPRPAAYQRAMKKLGGDPESILVIGDQIFTDILGANLAGLPSILAGYIGKGTYEHIGKRRQAEELILKTYHFLPYYKNRLAKMEEEEGTFGFEASVKAEAVDQTISQFKRFLKREILFCDINPTCYAISEKKEHLKRYLKDRMSKEKFATEKTCNKLAHVCSTQSSNLIKRGKGIDPVLQYNKATNIAISCDTMCGLIIHPGETFSFWKLVGETTEKKGYLPGRVIENNVLKPGLGGGLCNLANTIHLLVLDTPMEVTELHTHSDALAPDHGSHKPFATGTSVNYNNLDFRFKNVTDQDVQLLVWCEDEKLFGEFRSEHEFSERFELVEEDHHFRKEGDKYFRVSKIYRMKIDRATDQVVEKKLLLDNHSEVMYDYSQIPVELIRE